MKKTILFYYSVHHGNTQKLAEAAKARLGATIVRLPCKEMPDVRNYELVGVLSGIYLAEFGKPILALIDSLDLTGKTCCAAYTCGSPFGKYGEKVEARLSGKGAQVLPGFSCRGYDTFGLLKWIGGIARKHPNAADVDAFVRYLEAL